MTESLTKPLRPFFFLGDAWCYYKFYTGPKSADLLLTQVLAPAAADLLAGGCIDSWFFIRYFDPHAHVRLRLRLGAPGHYHAVIDKLHGLLLPWVEQGLVWRVQTDTYQREIERYGRDTMALSEEIFHLDSLMVVGTLVQLDGDAGERVRWLMALRASDRLLDDFGLTLDEKEALIAKFRDGYGREFGLNKGTRQQLRAKYRRDKREIEEVLGADEAAEGEYRPLYQVLAARSAALRPLAAEINSLVNRSESDVKRNDLLCSYLHMMNNRFFRTRQRLHELVLYDFLALYYRSRQARQKSQLRYNFWKFV
jgi:thiopeptide-type bacteriocin biosynthesis protein